MAEQTPNPSNPTTKSQPQQAQKDQNTGQSFSGKLKNDASARVGNNVEKDEPLAQTDTGGMKGQV